MNFSEFWKREKKLARLDSTNYPIDNIENLDFLKVI